MLCIPLWRGRYRLLISRLLSIAPDYSLTNSFLPTSSEHTGKVPKTLGYWSVPLYLLLLCLTSNTSLSILKCVSFKTILHVIPLGTLCWHSKILVSFLPSLFSGFVSRVVVITLHCYMFTYVYPSGLKFSGRKELLLVSMFLISIAVFNTERAPDDHMVRDWMNELTDYNFGGCAGTDYNFGGCAGYHNELFIFQNDFIYLFIW